MKKFFIIAALAASIAATLPVFSQGGIDNGCASSTASTAGLCVRRDANAGIAVGNVNLTGSTIPTTGSYNSGGTFTISTAGARAWSADNDFRGNHANGAQLRGNVASSATVPTVNPNRADATDGFGADGTNLYGIINSAAVLSITSAGVYSSGLVQAGTGIFVANTFNTWANNQTCTAGQMTWDANFIYVCTATNTVKRIALLPF